MVHCFFDSTKDTQVDRTEDVVDRIERIDPYGQWSASLSQKIAANVP